MQTDEVQEHAPATDLRLYAPRPEGWEAHLKHGWDKEYCFSKGPDEDYFHLLLNGEIYLQRDTEKYCLNCALRLGLLTTDRLYWQRGKGETDAEA